MQSKSVCGPPDEHAAVPQVAVRPGGEVTLGRRLVGLLLESLDHAGGGTQRLAQLQVAVARGGLRRRDAERHQGLGMVLRHFESLGDDLLEAIDGADEMVGREDGDHRVRVVPGDHGRPETDGIERVAAGRLAEELLWAQPGDGVEDRRACFSPAQMKRRSAGISPSSRW